MINENFEPHKKFIFTLFDEKKHFQNAFLCKKISKFK